MQTVSGGDVFFLLMGAILVLFMHAGFAFLEAGTVRKKNQVNALVKILADFAVSTVLYFFIGYTIAYGINFLASANVLATKSGVELVKFFFLLTFAAAVPAIISGGIAERARFWPQAAATALIVGLVYPFYEGLVWGERYDVQAWFELTFGAKFHDFAGSVVVHAMGGWLALGAVLLLGARGAHQGRQGHCHPAVQHPVPGAWFVDTGGGLVRLQRHERARARQDQRAVAMNSLMAMAGGVLGGLMACRNDPGFAHNGALAGLVAVCAGSDVMHPIGALVVGGVAGVLFVIVFTLAQHRWKIDDVLGVWPLHGLAGTWGGIACGIFGSQALGMGGCRCWRRFWARSAAWPSP